MPVDFIHNGAASGEVGAILLENGFNANALRPYIGKDGNSYITQTVNGVSRAVRTNATATLRKDEWKALDLVLIEVARERLRAVGDLRAAGLTYVIPNGLGKTVLETETIGDINDASISMDPDRQGENDRPEYELSSLPLPVTHKDFSFSARQIAVSRNTGVPLDMEMLKQSARKVAESNEKLLLGTLDSYTYGGGTIYGYTNWTGRITYTLTSPATSGWTGADLLANLLAMRKESFDAMHYGPFQLYTSPDWDAYLDADYATGYPKTLRSRILEVEGFSGMKTLDYLTDYDILMVQMTSDVIREVIGMDLTTVQWPSNGGMKLNFKVMDILVPQLRADQNSNTGLVHGSV